MTLAHGEPRAGGCVRGRGGGGGGAKHSFLFLLNFNTFQRYNYCCLVCWLLSSSE